MNLHLVDDEKFIDGAIDLFEKYSSKENVFIVNSRNKHLKYIKNKKIRVLNFSSFSLKKDLESVVLEKRINKVFVHYLDEHKAAIVNYLVKRFSLKIYWVFFGADLYELLHRDFNYPLYDIKIDIDKSLYSRLRTKLSEFKFLLKYGDFPKSSWLKCIKNLDYFCFWNHLDYELLIRYYETSAEFLYFVYFNALEKEPVLIEKTNGIEVVVNNSGSLNGNHLTLLEKINLIDRDKTINKVIVPLSYGNFKVINDAIEFGLLTFNERFFPVIDFLDKTTYFNLFRNVSVAFYGARRQEAGGNIFSLLGNGVKVFLRNDNNMLFFLRNKGYIVFSFENDFNTLEDLKPLNEKEKQLNRSRYQEMFCYETEKFVMEYFLMKI